MMKVALFVFLDMAFAEIWGLHVRNFLGYMVQLSATLLVVECAPIGAKVGHWDGEKLKAGL